MGKDNLVSLADRTTEEQREIAIQGGKASGEARRKKKGMKEALKLLLELDVKSPKLREQMKQLGIDDDNLTNEMALMVAQLQKAMKGDVQSANFIRDTSGQKPVEVQEVRELPTIVDDIVSDK